ncbi:sigma-54-dependent Fis family transcriptional regulator [Archangium violaceum]|uniref:sigma-54 interaction domain-containing protein n=1 Tax=Archangium violaceum TaxID=83451 RepID=UPI00193BBE13|nr:sigma-54 dependent transcriptional regulator [Archangium violaceum]QRK09332.1 sigma-54-dependent Fis family transcriptional regulator [Archangium violaceum]
MFVQEASILHGDNPPCESPHTPPAPTEEGFILTGRAMRKLAVLVERVAASRVPIVLHGETGTGKEVLSRLLHERGPRRARRMVRVNCGAIPKELVEGTLFGHERGAFTGAVHQQRGVFEEADGGTIFLDEIGELPLSAQAALLRVLETGSFSRVGSSREVTADVRIIAATHRDLEAMVEAGSFRADLYYRLSTLVLEIPPLRERLDELDSLARHFLMLANQANGRDVRNIHPQALARLRGYSWPGNVRELKNVIDRAVLVARAQTITEEDLPERLRDQPNERPEPGEPRGAPPPSAPPALAQQGEGASFRERLQHFEAGLLLEALQGAGWNQTEAARRLGLPVRTLSYRMKLLGLRRP